VLAGFTDTLYLDEHNTMGVRENAGGLSGSSSFGYRL